MSAVAKLASLLIATFPRLLNIGLRGVSLGAKFVLLLFLAVFLEPESVGLYGLLAASIGWTIYLVGWDFYTFSTRYIIGSRQSEIKGILQNKAALYFATYGVLSPLLGFAFALDVLPLEYGFWFVVLVILEHLGLEIGRILVALSRPLTASTMLFLRGGLWCLLVVALFALVPESRDLHVVFALWTLGSASGFVMGVVVLNRIAGKGAAFSLDWSWIKQGLGVALPLMIASLAIRGIFTVDRFWVEAIGDGSTLGAYVLYVSAASAILSFVDAGIVDFAYPRVVRAAKAGDLTDFYREMRRLGASILAVAPTLSLVCWAGIVFFAERLPNPIYGEHLVMLPYVLVAVLVYSLSTIPHVALYGHNKDLVIVASQVAGLATMIATIVLGQSAMGVMVVPVSLVIGFLVVFAVKLAGFVMLLRDLRSTAGVTGQRTSG